MSGTDKGLSWCSICRTQIGAYNKAIVDGDRDAARDALDAYMDHRRDDIRHRPGATALERKRAATKGLALCRDVLARTPNRALI